MSMQTAVSAQLLGLARTGSFIAAMR